MISMSKYEMVQYLKDYSMLSYLMIHNSKETIGVLFDNYMIKSKRYNCDNIEYYDRMRRTFQIYVIMKIFSFTEDYLLNQDNFLNDNDLNDIIPDHTYTTNLDGLSKKKIIQLIRNGFNHNNDSDKVDRFKISKNAKNIEIEFLKIKRSSGKFEPVKMKLSTENLLSIYNDMTLNRQNILSVSFDIPEDFDMNSNDLYHELSKIRFVHYYFTSKLSKETIKKFNDIENAIKSTRDDILKYSELFNHLSSELGECVSYGLNDDQKRKLVHYLSSYKKCYNFYTTDDKNAVLFYFLSNVIPIAGMKLRTLYNQIFISERFMLDVDVSFSKIVDQVASITLNGINPFDFEDSWDQDTYNMMANQKNTINHSIFRDILDGETFSGLPLIMYIDAVVTQCCKPGETIDIDGNSYPIEKIRNSLAHGRWFLTTNMYICFYDANTRNVNDYKLEFVAKLRIESLIKWADQYLDINKNRFDEDIMMSR